jgi:putative phage-type endonuclease
MLTAEEIAWRRNYIGSSDVPALFGLDPYKTLTQLFWEKVEEMPNEEETEAMEIGNLLEEPIIQWCEKRIGHVIERKVRLVSEGSDGGIFAANLDGRVRNTGVEAKFSGNFERWGDEGTDQVPERVILQTQEQCHVGKLDDVLVPAFIVDYRASFRLYRVKRHPDLIDMIVSRGIEFWEKNVKAGTPPDKDPTPPEKLLKALRREPSNVVDLGNDALATWGAYEKAKHEAEEAEKEKKRAYARVLACLGTAEAGRLPDQRLITYLEQNSTPSCDFLKLRMNWPDAFEACVTQGRHRTLRIKDLNKKNGRRR